MHIKSMAQGPLLPLSVLIKPAEIEEFALLVSHTYAHIYMTNVTGLQLDV